MKKKISFFITLFLLFFANINFAQAPDLGLASGFAVFTGAGAFEVFGASTIVTGDVGTNIGAFSGFPPGVLIGDIYYPGDPAAVQASVDLTNAYGILAGMTCGIVLSNPLGNGQYLTPNIYCLGEASTLNGDLILDGQGDPDALFIFQVDGAFATSTLTNVLLTNSASLCNVYWQINGAFTLGEGSVFRGNVLANGAIHLLEGSSFYGRALTKTGAIDLHNNIVTVGLPAEPSIISANGPTAICQGDEVILSGNDGGTWNTGETTPTITVNSSDDYFVTNTSSCGTVVSNHIIVTVNPLPFVQITGDTEFCLGESLVLTASSGDTYLWSTNETTQSITVTQDGNYSVTVTDVNGCEGSAGITLSYIVVTIPDCPPNMNVLVSDAPIVLTGGIPPGGIYYLNGIAISSFDPAVQGIGTYIITYTIDDICGPQSCTFTILVEEVIPLCEDAIILNFPAAAPDVCEGELYSLDFSGVVIENALDTLWEVNPFNAGVIENEIFTLNAEYEGMVTITLTAIAEVPCDDAQVSVSFSVNPLPLVQITGDTEFCLGESLVLTASLGDTYLWSTNETTQSITVTQEGNYSVIVTDVNGCEGSAEITLSYFEGTIPDCPPNMNVLVTDAPFVLSGASPPGGIYYLNGIAISSFDPAVQGIGTYIITYTIDDICGPQSCTFTILVEEVIPLCEDAIILNFPAAALDVCEGELYSLDFSGVVIENALDTLWEVNPFNAGVIENEIFTLNAEYEGMVTITLTAIAEVPCDDAQVSVSFSVNPMPFVNICCDYDFCIGDSTVLTASEGNSYLWSTGETTQSITVFESGNYSVTIIDVNGCSGEEMVYITVYPLPIASIITADGPTIFCEGEEVILSGNVGGTWNTGETTPSITVFASGEYFVLNENECECVISNHIIVIVDQWPVGAEILIDGPTTICEPAFVVLTGNDGSVWNTGETTPNIYVSESGDYFVITTNTCGVAYSNHIVLTVDPLPIPSIITADGPTTICEGEEVILSGNVGGVWNTGETTPTLTVNTSGEYYVINKNECGIDYSNFISVTVNSIVSITTQPVSQISCFENLVSFSVFADGTGFTYQWRKGTINLVDGGNISGSNTATLTIDPPDISDNASDYNVIISGLCSGSDTSIYVSLEVFSLPVACITVCEGDRVRFSSPVSESGLTYQWRKGNVNLEDGGNISGSHSSFLTINPVNLSDEATDYNVVIIGRCFPFEVSNNICLEVLPLLRIDMVNMDTLSCEDFELYGPKQYQLHSNVSGYETLIWTSEGNGTFSDPTIPDPIYTFSEEDMLSGSVSFKLTVYSTKTCSVEFSDSMIVIIPAQIIPIPAGWSGISSYINSFDPGIKKITQQCIDEIIVQESLDGVYLPDEDFNTFISWDPSEGYNVKYAQSCCLSIYGTQVNWPSKIHMNEGVNYLPVHSLTPIKMQDLFGADTSKIILLIDIYTLQVYNPGFEQFNTLKYLEPGLGYIAYMSQPVDIIYAQSTTLLNPDFLSGEREPYHVNNATTWNNLISTGSMHYISVEKTALSDIQTGDFLGAFLSDGICVGMAEYTGGNRLLLPIFGDDLYTTEKDGMDNNEDMIFKLYRHQSGEVKNLSATYDLTVPENDGLYEKYGFSRIILLKEIKTDLGNLPEEKIAIFPNPSFGLFTIQSDITLDNINLLNLFGETVFSERDLNSGEYLLDATQYPEGIYFIAIKTSTGKVTNHKIILQ